ncbi:MAG TPA: outer membrane beta-barrel protein [Haliangiales bacterium]|nr:outer membrane beta-barrel protein [Haliangiales bacterium]
MKFNKWTVGLAAGGVVSLASVVQAEEAQKPMSQVMTAVSSTTLSGYVDTSAIWKFGTGNANLPGRAFDGVGKLDGFNLNVAEIQLEKPLSEEQWAAGYRVQLLVGPDANNYNLSPTSTGSSDFSLKDAYVALRVPAGNGIDFKVGSFTTVVGYESFESYLDPNYSRSFGWQLEPTQHTGVLASYKATDAVSFSGGIANTWNAGVNARPTRGAAAADESEKTYMASVSITAPDSWGFLSGSAWYAGIIDGLAGNTKDTTTLYAGGSLHTPVEGLSIGGAFDYRFNGPNTVTVGNNWAWAVAGYASFAATEKLKFNVRGDYTEGSDGTFYNRLGGNLANRLGALTLTADYALWANVISRAELRWDHSMSGDTPYGGTVPGVGVNRNAVTLAANLIYKF